MSTIGLWISWFLFAPAFFFISKRQGMETWKRWLFTILSPSWCYIAFIVLVLVLLIADFMPPKSLDFDKVKFNTPEQVTTELGLKDLPEFEYVGNTAKSEFNFDYWDCVVEFKFVDTLSVQAKNNIIKQVARKDELHWVYKNIASNGVAEYYNISYKDEDTTRYNIVMTNDKIYVAYSCNLHQPLSEELFRPSEYHLIGVRNGYFGADSSHEWIIQLKEPYTQYLNRFADGWKREDAPHKLSFIKETYRNDHKQSECIIVFNKKKNVAIISYESY